MVAAGACAPPLGPVMRALWSSLLTDRELRLRAFSLDAVAEELLLVVGPLVAGLFIAFGNPAAGVGLSALLVLTGTVAMVSSPALRTGSATPTTANESKAETAAETASPPGRWLQGAAGWLAPSLIAGGVGVCLGALSLLVVAVAEQHHQIAAVAWIEAALAVGCLAGGLAYGARSWRLPSRHRLPLPAIALALVLSAAGLMPNLYLLAVATACAGLFVAPALTTAYLAADECAMPGTRTQAGTWVNSAFNAGASGGTAAVGLLLGRLPLWLCFVAAAAPTLVTATAVLVRLLLPGRLPPRAPGPTATGTRAATLRTPSQDGAA